MGLTVQTTNGLSAVLESTNSYQHLQFKNSGYIENYIDFTNRDFNITCDNVNRFTINGTTGAATFGGTLSSGGITTTGNTSAGQHPLEMEGYSPTMPMALSFMETALLMM
jgi:hypothetical protein